MRDNAFRLSSTVTIRDIKLRQSYALPAHWVNDWLLHVIDQPAHFLITDSDYLLSQQQLSEFERGIKQMQAGTPLAYLLGKQEFWSLEFLVNEHTLIPRPDTEVLVEQVLAWISQQERFHHNSQNSLSKQNQLLDLGTGSGCIAISLAHELNKHDRCWQITAVDYSAEALQVAKDNAQLNVTPAVVFIQSDWFAAIDKEAKFDVIVSNPPYIDPDDQHLTKLISEPIAALVADNKGLADIEKIINGAVSHLSQKGVLAIEHGYDQGRAVYQLFEQTGFVKIKTVQDYGGNDRVTMGEWLG